HERRSHRRRSLCPRTRQLRAQAQGRGSGRDRPGDQAGRGQLEPATMALEDPGHAMTLSILHIGKYYPPVAGGMERFLGDLVGAQRAEGHRVAVLAHTFGRMPVRDDPPWVMRAPVWIRLLFAPISFAFPF